jgi:hypothetical protein
MQNSKVDILSNLTEILRNTEIFEVCLQEKITEKTTDFKAYFKKQSFARKDFILRANI